MIAFPDVRLKKGQQYGANYDPGGLPHQSRSPLLKTTGGDAQTFRKAHSQEQWTGVLPGKVWIVSNEVPNFNDPVLPTRFLKLYFGINQEKAGRIDALLGDKLRAELPGIARRCLSGYQRMVARRDRTHASHCFVQPASGLVLERELEKVQHPHRAMVLACLEVSEDPDEWVVREDARRACAAWLRQNDHKELAGALKSQDMSGHLANVFDHIRQLASRDRWVQRADGRRRWKGLRLSAEGLAVGDV